MSNQTRLGTALIVSGPSASGKSTVCKAAMHQRPDMRFSISCTTRPPRPGETDAVDYYFISRQDFESRLSNGEFLEHAEVHGNLYGTLKSEILDRVSRGEDVILDIDVQGALQIKKLAMESHDLASCLEFLFFAPPGLQELERRLRGRGTETEKAMQLRLSNARRELDAWREYSHIIVNRDIESSVIEMLALLDSCKLSTKRFKEPPFDA